MFFSFIWCTHTGYYATLIRDVPYTMMELGLYENIKSAIRRVRSKSELTQKEELMAAAVTGAHQSVIDTVVIAVITAIIITALVAVVALVAVTVVTVVVAAIDIMIAQ